ncbi:MAG: hypothetical protein R3B13_12520 [Polyangiaceae bacterium]
MVRSRKFRTPFVITTAAAVSTLSLAACGGSTNENGGTGGTSGAAGSGGNSTGGSGAATTGGSGGVAGSGGTPADGGVCPPEIPTGYQQCAPGLSCKYDVKCQSGAHGIVYTCGEFGYWDVTGQSCDKPYDSCPNTDLYCSGSTWTIPGGTNPPAPCPNERPALGAACFSGGLGGVWENCGYACAAGSSSSWTVMSCKYDPNDPTGQSQWTSDGACDP